LQTLGFKGSTLEKFMLLAVAGGVPWYLELFNGKLSAGENIRSLCFEPEGILVDEFKHIFHDLFGRRSKIYGELVTCLAKGSADYQTLATKLGYASGGPLSEYLDDLIMSGFLNRDFTWDLKSGQVGKLSKYRLSDNYLRFYLKYIAPQFKKIKQGLFKNISITTLPNWEAIMGLQFENLVLHNRDLIHEQLVIKPEEIVFANPFFQRATSKQKGCQIDYLIQTRAGNLYVCEIKFSKQEIASKVIEEVKQKINNLKAPKGYACIPVLIHVNGVTPGIMDNDYFIKTIDFSQFIV